MKIVVDIPQIRVVRREDYEGSSAICLDMLGQYVLYKFPDSRYFEEETAEAEREEDAMRSLIGQMFGKMLLAHFPHLAEQGWRTQPPNREIDYHSPAYEEIGDL